MDEILTPEEIRGLTWNDIFTAYIKLYEMVYGGDGVTIGLLANYNQERIARRILAVQLNGTVKHALDDTWEL